MLSTGLNVFDCFNGLYALNDVYRLAEEISQESKFSIDISTVLFCSREMNDVLGTTQSNATSGLMLIKYMFHESPFARRSLPSSTCAKASLIWPKERQRAANEVASAINTGQQPLKKIDFTRQ